MRKSNKLIIFLIIIVISTGMLSSLAMGNIFFPKNLNSGNSEKPTLKASSNSFGMEVCTASEKQFELVMCDDGNGNAITAWIDFRNYNYSEIYAQKIDPAGNVKWLKNGKKIYNNNVSLYILSGPNICSDNAGGAIISWLYLEEFEHTGAIKAQRIDADGNLLWGNNGTDIANTSWIFGFTQLCSDGAGGAFILWEDGGINIQKVGPNGNLLWSYYGLSEGLREGYKSPKMCSDGIGGVIITWDDATSIAYSDSANVYAQRFDAYGNYMWGENGTAICNADLGQYGPKICNDGTGGAIITWNDQREGDYAQRVDPNGNSLWQNNGTMICGYGQSIWGMKSDGENGMIFSYSQYSLEEGNFFGQKLDSAGNKVWGANGTKITSYKDPDYLFDIQICSDGEGGALFAWSLRKNWHSLVLLYNNTDIYAQKINLNGQAVWKENGLPVCVPASNFRSDDPKLQICNDGTGGAIVSYEFVRTNNAFYGNFPYLLDIHAQRISSSGDLQWNVEPDWIFFLIIGVIIGGIAIAVVITVLLIKRRK